MVGTENNDKAAIVLSIPNTKVASGAIDRAKSNG